MFYLTAQKSLWWWSHFLVVFSKKSGLFSPQNHQYKVLLSGFHGGGVTSRKALSNPKDESNN
jgi:hypothetical protein